MSASKPWHLKAPAFLRLLTAATGEAERRPGARLSCRSLGACIDEPWSPNPWQCRARRSWVYGCQISPSTCFRRPMSVHSSSLRLRTRIAPSLCMARAFSAGR
ncbi:hypothetical protein B0T14DRAFT_149827 [Immersiella caudata]|uniref:Secreted protein n=1 Tax=Immersiella caudata TaxID=314043 RepID=A0AA39WVY6_9PEZI|nr:hypothetical protein B0T14DRAFT_149827 [Immersiella caudata]